MPLSQTKSRLIALLAIVVVIAVIAATAIVVGSTTTAEAGHDRDAHRSPVQ